MFMKQRITVILFAKAPKLQNNNYTPNANVADLSAGPDLVARKPG